MQVVEQTDPILEQEVRSYLSALGGETGVCGEHDPRWLTVLRSALRHRTFMVIARRAASHHGGCICGYLPLALLSTRLFGRFLVSLPYLNRAGIVAGDDAPAQVLLDKAV